MKKITVIFTGGTIGCISAEGGRRLSDGQRYQLIDAFCERYGARDFICLSPFSVLSENMDAEHLLVLAAAVKDALEEADGVIVTHGTDTLAYTAAFLGFLFSNSEKPVCLVSSRSPIGESDSNGVLNFAAAVRLIEDTRLHRGVFVPYQNIGEIPRIFRATRLLMQSAFSDTVTALGGEYAAFDGERILLNKVYRAQPDALTIDPPHSLSRTVYSVYPTVGQPYPAIPLGCAAVLLHSYHSGTIATDSEALVAFLEDARERGIPVYLSGFSSDLQYESMERYARLGVVPLPKIAPIAAYIKLWLTVNLPHMTERMPHLSLGEDIF